MKNLLVMRHAKSDWSQQADDFDRPLNKRGRGDLPHVARMLGTVESGLPDLVISSSSQRARETATGVVQALRLQLFLERVGKYLPEILNALQRIAVWYRLALELHESSWLTH